MAIKHFTVTVDTGSSRALVDAQALTDTIEAHWSMGSGSPSLITATVGETYGDTGTPSTLPWRVKRDGVTIAATASPSEAMEVLLTLSSDLVDMSITFEMSAV